MKNPKTEPQNALWTREQFPHIGRPPLEDREKVASSHIHLRVTRKLKAAFVRHSHRQNKTLAEWLLGLGKKDCGYKGD